MAIAQLAGMMHVAQGNALQTMANQVTGAIGRENQSRVAQLREARRMQQQQKMKDMDIRALLIRLQHEREMAEMQMAYQREQDDRSRGILRSTRWRKQGG